MRQKKIILDQEYAAEEIVDIEEHIMYALDDLPRDEHGFIDGHIEVKVTHVPSLQSLPNHELPFPTGDADVYQS